MVNESRIDIYDYLYDIFYGYVSNNVYQMYNPQELTESDKQDGFLTIELGGINDESEFTGEAFARVRAYVTAYVPPMSRGRLDGAKYKTFENDITAAIKNEIQYGTNPHYSIQEDGILSMDDLDDSNANNIFYTYTKTFIVTIE